MSLTKEDIIRIRDNGEQTTVQFKERVTRDNKYDVACEMVALSNAHGGQIVIGINDKTGVINPLSFSETQETTNLLGDLASEGVVPQIMLDIENVPMDNGTVIVASNKEGKNKPYRDTKGIIWLKQGADKRKVFDSAEIVSMLMENGQIHPDSLPIDGASFSDLDENTVKNYLLNRFRNDFERQELPIVQLQQQPLEELAGLLSQTPEGILRNNGLILPDGRLTLAALMLMGKNPQRWLPAFTVRCISFVGNSIGGTEFRDKSGSDADGNIVHLYKYIMSFLTRNLRQKQVQAEFNSPGELEVSATSLSELVVNSLLHRSYVIEAPLRVFIFDNRIEIHSPGLLPDGVTLDSIKQGISVPRNKLLFNHGINLLPYTGAGSGITRALQYTPDIQFENSETLREFVITIQRETAQTSNLDTNSSTNLGTNLDTNSDTSSSPAKKRKTLKLKDLSQKQRDVVNFCSVPRSAREILERIGVINHTKNRKKYVLSLVELGFLEMTDPETPNAPNQKYRKVRK